MELFICDQSENGISVIGVNRTDVEFDISKIDNVTKIGDDAFTGWIYLKTINIPKGVTEIGNGAFRGCTSLKKIVIPEGVERIGASAFRNCTSLVDISLPSSLRYIGKEAFRECKALETIDIPNDVRHIGREAFRQCEVLKVINIPLALGTIEGRMFEDCCQLQQFKVPSEHSNIKFENGCLFDKYSKNIVIYKIENWENVNSVALENPNNNGSRNGTSGINGLSELNLFRNKFAIKDDGYMWLLLVAAEAWKVTFDNLPKFIDWAFEKFNVPFEKETCKSKLQEKLKGWPWSDIQNQDEMNIFIANFRSQANKQKADIKRANAIYIAIREKCLGEK